MKVSRKAWLIILVASVFGLTGCPDKNTDEAASSQSPIPEILPVGDNSIAVSLPIRTEVILRKGGSKSGRLTKIDREKKQIEIAKGGISESLKLAQIEKVKFKPDATIYSNKDLVVRGEDKSSTYQQETWMGIPLSDFQLLNPQKGEAKVNLTKSSVDKAKQKAIKTVAQDSIFVAKEMLFDTSDKIKLRVTSVDRQ